MRLSIFALVMVCLSACVPVATEPLPPETVLEGPGVAETEAVPFGEYQTYYERRGWPGRQPVLMIHGIGGGSSLFQYRKNTAAIALQGYDVYALDLLGFGRSSRPALRYTQELHVAQIEAFLAEVIRRPTVIVANGLSAAYSVRLAAERPDLVAGLVLVAPTGYESLAREQTEARIRAFERISGVPGETLYQVLLADNIQDIFLLDAYAGEGSLTPEVKAEFDQQLRVENAKWVILSFITGNLDQDVSNLWPGLEQPAVILWGEDATQTPISEAEPFLAARPEVDLIVFEGVKLLPNEDTPERFNKAVLSFLAGL